jgi:hypothetical protein
VYPIGIALEPPGDPGGIGHGVRQSGTYDPEA